MCCCDDAVTNPRPRTRTTRLYKPNGVNSCIIDSPIVNFLHPLNLSRRTRVRPGRPTCRLASMQTSALPSPIYQPGRRRESAPASYSLIQYPVDPRPMMHDPRTSRTDPLRLLLAPAPAPPRPGRVQPSTAPSSSRHHRMTRDALLSIVTCTIHMAYPSASDTQLHTPPAGGGLLLLRGWLKQRQVSERTGAPMRVPRRFQKVKAARSEGAIAPRARRPPGTDRNISNVGPSALTSG